MAEGRMGGGICLFLEAKPSVLSVVPKTSPSAPSEQLVNAAPRFDPETDISEGQVGPKDRERHTHTRIWLRLLPTPRCIKTKVITEKFKKDSAPRSCPKSIHGAGASDRDPGDFLLRPGGAHLPYPAAPPHPRDDLCE